MHFYAEFHSMPIDLLADSDAAKHTCWGESAKCRVSVSEDLACKNSLIWGGWFFIWLQVKKVRTWPNRVMATLFLGAFRTGGNGITITRIARSKFFCDKSSRS